MDIFFVFEYKTKRNKSNKSYSKTDLCECR